MKCTRCSGRLLLDRVFSDNTSFEVACLQCGDRKYVNKNTEFGKWLAVREKAMDRAQNGLA
jgi:DNA-directed RNA polymerase subunit RPC12/RpoP